MSETAPLPGQLSWRRPALRIRSSVLPLQGLPQVLVRPLAVAVAANVDDVSAVHML